MMSRFFSFLLLIVFLPYFTVGCGSATDGSKKYPDPLGVVSDYEGVFTATEVEQLTKLIEDYRRETGVEFAVVTLDQRHVKQDDFDAYTLALANDWGVGQRDKDNGVLIAFSKQYQCMRIQNGLGTERVMSDEQTATFMKDYMLTKFAQRQYYAGVRDGLRAIMDFLRHTDLVSGK